MSGDDTRALAATYSAIATDYEELWAPVLVPYTRQLLDALGFADAGSVLDLGTGVGSMLGELAARAPGACVVGADLSEGMLRLAPPAFPRVLSDAMRLPFADGAFDAVISAFVLFNVPEPGVAFTEVRRCTAPGGVFGMTTWGDAADAENAPARVVFDEELDRAGAGPDPVAALGSARAEIGAPDRLAGHLEAAGFDEVSVRVVAFEHPLDTEAFVRERTKLGPTGRRLASLDTDAAQVCLARARERIAALGPEDLTDHDSVLIATAHAG